MREGNMASEHDERVLVLTRALYRVTGLLASEEPLRVKLREKAIEIVEAVSSGDGILPKVRTMILYLTIAKAVGNPDIANFLVLEREYRAFADLWEERPLQSSRLEPRHHWAQVELKSTRFSPEKENMETGVSDARAGDGVTGAAEHYGSGELNDRQRAILERLNRAGQIKISDFYQILSGVSSKTIQRDLHDLVSRNMIKKEGEKRWTIYMRNDV